jgi:hypothetical protein
VVFRTEPSFARLRQSRLSFQTGASQPIARRAGRFKTEFSAAAITAVPRPSRKMGFLVLRPCGQQDQKGPAKYLPGSLEGFDIGYV